jgi:PiT family inorganic phosphate transporter
MTMEWALIAASMFIAATIGANDIANAIGTTVGANILSYRKATILAGVSVVAGALLAGSNTIDTVGKGILDTSALSLATLSIALFCAATAVAIATYLSFPVSATQSVVGALAGTGLATGIALNSSVLFDIAVVWTLLPFFSAAMSFLSFFAYKGIFSRAFYHRAYVYERFIALLVAGSGILVSFSLGSNNIGNAVGAVVAQGVMRAEWAILFGALFIAFGALLFSKRVILTIGKGITPLDPLQAFVCQFSSSFTVFACTIIGIPVSLSQATVGSVVGVGLTKGMTSVDRRFIVRIVGSWVATPLISGMVSYALIRLIA